MNILFDQGTPVPLRPELPVHQIQTAHELGWATLTNGNLLAAAETRFDALITTDKNLRYQQNLTGRKLAILVLPTTSWPRLREHIAEIRTAVDSLLPGDFRELEF
jgi:hypothetical protein